MSQVAQSVRLFPHNEVTMLSITNLKRLEHVTQLSHWQPELFSCLEAPLASKTISKSKISGKFLQVSSPGKMSPLHAPPPHPQPHPPFLCLSTASLYFTLHTHSQSHNTMIRSRVKGHTSVYAYAYQGTLGSIGAWNCGLPCTCFHKMCMIKAQP